MSAYEEAQKARNAHYDTIKHLANKFEWATTYGHAHCRYEAITNHPEARKLSPSDVMLLAAGGNLCFGGRNASKREVDYNTVFSGIIYTD